MRRIVVLLALILVVGSAAGCAPASTSDGTGDGLHSIVPDVRGLTLGDATSAIEEAGYVVGDVSGDGADDPLAVVVEQSPVASTSLPREAPVDLVVAGNR